GPLCKGAGFERSVVFWVVGAATGSEAAERRSGTTAICRPRGEAATNRRLEADCARGSSTTNFDNFAVLALLSRTAASGAACRLLILCIVKIHLLQPVWHFKGHNAG